MLFIWTRNHQSSKSIPTDPDNTGPVRETLKVNHTFTNVFIRLIVMYLKTNLLSNLVGAVLHYDSFMNEMWHTQKDQ